LTPISEYPPIQFDNRWIPYPQDFPSGEFFGAHGIRRVVVVQEADGETAEDLYEVLLGWQRLGLAIEKLTDRPGTVPAATVVQAASRIALTW
jgi:hypothetical protein